MSSLPRIVALALAGLALSCAGAGSSSPRDDADLEAALEQHNAKAEESERIVCVREYPIGSHIARRVCRTVAETEREREAVRQSERGAIRGPSPDTGPVR